MKRTLAAVQKQLRLSNIALRRSETHWNLALESAGIGVWDSDIPNDTVAYSGMWKRMRGYEPDEFVDSSASAWLKRIHPDDHARIQDAIGKQDIGEIERNAFEYRERHKAGHYIWISSLGAPVEWEPDGTPTRIIGIDTDITKRKIIEQEYLELSRRLELALNVSKVGVYEANLETGELFWDDRTYEIYGLDRAQGPLNASDWQKSLHPDDAAETISTMDRAAKARGTYNATFRIVRPDGEVRTLMSRGVYTQDGNTTPRIVGADWDISGEIALNRSLRLAKDLAEARNIELDAARKRMEHASLHDALTGLANRRYLDAVLDSYFERSADRRGGLALLHLDLDGFKNVNDTLGHHAGDVLLVQVAQRLSAGVSEGSVVARIGGDEFVVIMDGEKSRMAALQRADSLRDSIARPFTVVDQTVFVGCSVGIAMAPADGETAVDLVVASDLALYRAKEAGRNISRAFVPEYLVQMQERQSLEAELRNALEQGEFELLYQPQVELASRRIIGVEALLRWNHPRRGLLAPSAFLPTLKVLPFADAVGSWVLRQASTEAAKLEAAGHSLRVGVNLFSSQFRSGGLVEVVADALLETGLSPDLLELEITERIVLDDDGSIPATLRQLRKLGVHVACDDYGTGFANFSTLRRFPLTRLKIDRSFVTNLATDKGAKAIVQAVLQLGQGFDLEVIAEGIETELQATILSGLGGKLGQGYLFGRPSPIADIWRLLEVETASKMRGA